MSAAASSGGGGGGGGGSSAGGAGSARLHARSFKLRFATQHELGRSNVSAVKPRGLPSVVRGADAGAGAADAASEASALQRVRALFRDGPREKHPAPLTASHEYDTVTDHTRYGWWWARGAALEAAARRDPRLRHHIRDSAWLKERLRVLAADDGLQRR